MRLILLGFRAAGACPATPQRRYLRQSMEIGCAGYAADSNSASQPGHTRTVGWHLSARARTFARSTPRLTRPFSMAETVACGMPVSSESWLWLAPGVREESGHIPRRKSRCASWLDDTFSCLWTHDNRGNVLPRFRCRRYYATWASGSRISTDSKGTETEPSSDRSTKPSSSSREMSVCTLE